MHAAQQRHLAFAIAIGLLGCAAFGRAQDAMVAQYHNTADHAGMFVVPGLDLKSVAATRLDPGFAGTVPGVINAAPLYWRPAKAASGFVIVASDSNDLVALDDTTGQAVWRRRLGAPASRDGQCGNINPVGVTGTPVIDPSTGTLYADAVLGVAGGQRHMLFAVSVANGAIKPGFPVAIGAGVRGLGKHFDDAIEEQRGALTLMDGTIYVPFGGYVGDCGPYHGIVAAISVAKHAVMSAWSTKDEKGGIWSPGGIVASGASLFVSTGNTADATSWGGGEAVIRLSRSLAPINDPNDFFSPRDWRELDNEDQDLGGVAPTLLDLPGGSLPHAVLALGKDGNAYLLNRDALGGIGRAVRTAAVADEPMRGATAVYKLGADAMVVLNAHGPTCEGPGDGILAIRVDPGVSLAPAWCSAISGRGVPIVTTSDGVADPIVWVAGAEGDQRLHAFNGANGRQVYVSDRVPETIAHFTTLLVANHRLYLTARGHVYAFVLYEKVERPRRR